MRLQAAEHTATRLLEALAPACDRIEIAGSIRRRKAEVKDIEIVAIPKWHEQPHTGVQIGLDMVQPTEHVNVLAVAVQAFEEADALWVTKPGTPNADVVRWHLDPTGKYWRLYVPVRGIRVDLFIADVDTWGCTLAYRTGPADFSRAMLARWKQVSGGGYSLDSRLYRFAHREPEPTPEERDVFEACQVAWLDPVDRTDEYAVARYALTRPAVAR